MRAVVNWASGRYVKGQERLTEWLSAHDEEYFIWRDQLPAGAPKHEDVPYAAKAFALRSAQAGGARTLLWADACVLPIAPLEPLWERIEHDGYWISSQAGPEPDAGYTNYEWTADAAYKDLFAPDHASCFPRDSHCDASDRGENKKIPHVVATTFGISLDHPTGRAILAEYFRLASTTKAFCGPWTNFNSLPTMEDGKTVEVPLSQYARTAPCGPSDVRGHRHDQTAASLIAWRMGMRLTPGHRDPEGDILAYPEWFPERKVPERCILIHDGSMK